MKIKKTEVYTAVRWDGDIEALRELAKAGLSMSVYGLFSDGEELTVFDDDQNDINVTLGEIIVRNPDGSVDTFGDEGFQQEFGKPYA